MDGEVILLSDQVLKNIDDLRKKKRQCTELEDSEDLLTVADSMAGETEVPDSLITR